MVTVDDTAAARARLAYETLEPFHVLAYFNPRLAEAQSDLSLDPHAFYVGAVSYTHLTLPTNREV